MSFPELPANYCPTCGDELETDGKFAICSEHGRMMITVSPMQFTTDD